MDYIEQMYSAAFKEARQKKQEFEQVRKGDNWDLFQTCFADLSKSFNKLFTFHLLKRETNLTVEKAVQILTQEHDDQDYNEFLDFFWRTNEQENLPVL